MNLDELQSARDRERQTDKLQQLRPTFYEDAGEFIRQLRAERERVAAQAENPLDAPEVGRLTDEIHTAEQIVEALYENRIGKIVKAASLDAAGLGAEVEGMTTEEEALFETLVGDIQSHRQEVLAVLDGPEGGAEGTAIEDSLSPDVSAADLMGSDDAPESEAPATDHADRREDRPEGTDTGSEDTDDGITGSNGEDEDPSPNSRDASTADGQQPGESTGSPAGNPPDAPVREDGGGTAGDTGGDSAGDDAAGQGSRDARTAVAGAATSGTEASDAETGAALEATPTPPDGAPGDQQADTQLVQADDDAGQPTAGETGRQTPAGDSTESAAEADPLKTGRSTAAAEGDAAGESEAVGETDPTAAERIEVRVTDGVETFVGVDDRDYDLEADDVVSLPAANATLLLERDVAEPLD